MAAVFSFRSRKASANARGGRQEATMASIPGVTAATKLWVDTGRCPHLPGSLSSLVLPRNPQPRVNNPGNVRDLSQTVASSHRSQLVTVGTLYTPQLCVSYSSLSSPTEQASPSKLLLSFPVVWVENRPWRVPYKQRWTQNQSRALGAVWV